MFRRTLLNSAWRVGAWLACATASLSWAEEKVDYSQDIRPILSDTCYQCHGPDAAERQAGLRLDVKEAALAELESGNIAIVPGQSHASELVARITTDDPDLRMPPPDSGKELTPEQIDKIRRWIEEGATWEEHWAFRAPQRPPLPEVQHEEWIRNPIDRFVLARQERGGLKPSPPADKVTLLRRVTLGLTGLPPTLEETEAFLKDDSPRAYEKVVDRLMTSPRYGEHQARAWLDAARYGDTHGLHLDNERAIWPYREWVIKAFNGNMPFNQFTIEQLAGDLLPDPTVDQLVATGFNRCNVTTSEGGAIPEEFAMRYAVDRVETTATVWMGLTVGCAACHDHKFDPISQKEFYQLFAFFNSLTENPMDGNALAPPPVVPLPSPEQQARKKELQEQLAAIDQRIRDEVAKIEYVDPQPEASSPQPREDYVWVEDEQLPAGAQPGGNGDPAWNFVGQPEHPVYSGSKSVRRSAKGLSQHLFTGAQPPLQVGADDRLFAYVYLDPNDPPREIMLQFNDGSWEHRAVWGDDLIDWGTTGTPSRRILGPLPPVGEWVRLEVPAAEVGLGPGAQINGWAFTQFDGTVYWDHAGIHTSTPQGKPAYRSLAAWAQAAKESPGDLPEPIKQIVGLAAEQRTPEQAKQLRDYFLEHVYSETRSIFQPLHQEKQQRRDELSQLDKSIPVSLIMQDLPEPREAFVLVRGQYNKPGEKVERGVPSVLPPLPEDAPRNRLGLAQWLVAPSHPLTARVTVNRIWQQHFGTGLVRTSEDFGSQGEWPSHPQLLDWLAVEFIESGWDVKHLHKLIVMSATYQQSSQVTPELQKQDPENRLLARGPRFRMPAEMLRDTTLFVSGLLVEQLGGPSVKPYQPPGLWEAVAYPTSTTAKFARDEGAALYRRSLYTFWKRTSPPPSMATFDAPTREACTVRRARTNTPLQALVLMNDEQFVEAARHLARRVMREGGATAAERAAYGFQLATSRKPDDRELAVLLRTYEKHRQRYHEDPAAAEQLLGFGASPPDEALDRVELAAWTMLGNLILNLDETITQN